MARQIPPSTQIAVFGGGCFWCTEAIFKMLKGVVAVAPGYAGGTVPNPTDEAVYSGATGHAEVTRVEYDPAAILYSDLLTVFFNSHDPTTLNRQGSDVGEQYRSVIFYTNDEQRKAALACIKELNQSLNNKIVTQVEPLTIFYPAENYHQDYYAQNKNQPYCQAVISPKLKKVREKFKQLLATHIN